MNKIRLGLILSKSIFFKLIPGVLLVFCYACTPIERIPSRSMTVSSGPDKVFERPVANILPDLGNAEPTGINGRVGNEMVFWGYRLSDNRDVNLFACAMLEDINCESRIRGICPAGGEELSRAIESGIVRHLNCRAVGVVASGELLPNCDDNVRTDDLLVGLIQCN